MLDLKSGVITAIHQDTITIPSMQLESFNVNVKSIQKVTIIGRLKEQYILNTMQLYSYHAIVELI